MLETQGKKSVINSSFSLMKRKIGVLLQKLDSLHKIQVLYNINWNQLLLSMGKAGFEPT